MPYTLKPWPTLINNILERNDQQLDTISKFKLENQTVSSPELIANKFNEQFTYIGPTLAEKINYPKDNHLSSLSFSKVTGIRIKFQQKLFRLAASLISWPLFLKSRLIYPRISS